METLEEYLNKQHPKSTVKRYLRDIKQYLQLEPKAREGTIKEVLNYLGNLREQKKSNQTVRNALYAIKRYYDWLLFTKQRQNHPCKHLNLKDKRSNDIQLQDLFSKEELELLLTRKERYKLLEQKNKVLVSLLIYQGLTTGEITRLSIKDLDLEEGTIFIQSSRKLNSRTLPLQKNQILLFYKYLETVRSQLLKVKSEQLIITKSGTPEKGEGIDYLIGTMKSLFPERNLNPKTIRQSVIANLLKEKDLRYVQVFAGHKFPSSTEKYKQTNLEELKSAVLKYHPLDGNEFGGQ